MGRLEGKRAFITGAAQGIGGTGAKMFAREGATVFCTDIDTEGAEAVAAGIRADGGKATAMLCDVSSEENIRAAVAAAADAMGGIDIAWANAGAPAEGRAGDIGTDLFDRTVNLNLRSAWLTAKFALPHLIESGAGCLIFTASTAGLRGSPNVAAYAAAKAGVIGLSRQIAMDYAGQGVRSNVVCPGTTLTKMMTDSYAKRSEMLGVPVEELIARTTSGMPLKRLGMAEDQANLALFLASDESGWMTGHAIAVDGGRFAQF